MTSREHGLPGFIELAELGAGAQGEVVLARHESGGGPVAIKYLAVDLLGNTEARNTFRTEAEMLKRVTNPHVARLLDYLESPWGAAIVLEAVAGRPLRKVLDEHDGPLTPEAALTTLKGSLLGLAAAHAVGVVHRDYKPANVLVQDDGQSKLIDFGVAVLTGQGGHIGGTPAYMAPEQWAGEPATPATDLYAATCVFVECVSGEKPFHGATLEELRAEHTNTPAPLERVPEPLRQLVGRGMAKSPSDRLWNAYEFVSELETIAVRTYGPDWERRGLIVLGAIAATVTTAIPLGMLGGALLAPGAAGTTTAGTAVSGVAGHASAMYSQGAATADVMTKVGSSTSKSFMAKIGGAKGATGIGAVGAGAAVIAWLFWPASPTVGGASQGSVHGYFTNPGALLGQPSMPAADTPYMDLKLSVAPARAKPGTKVQMVIKFNARISGGAKYWPNGSRQCFGDTEKGHQTQGGYGFTIGTDVQTKHENFVAFYRIPPARPQELPEGRNATIIGSTRSVTGKHEHYSQSECATMSEWTETRTFTIPASKALKPGKYLLSPTVPVQITGENGDVPPESMGPVTEGALPLVEVLDG